MLYVICCDVQMKMSYFATKENVPFMPRKLVDNEWAIRFA